MSPDKGSVTQLSANGTARRQLDRHGMLWVAETAQRAVLRMSLDGRYTVFADACRGEPFLFLDDLTLGPNGDLKIDWC